MVDSKGTLHKGRTDITKDYKEKLRFCQITNAEQLKGNIAEAMEGADAVVALAKSGPDVIKKEWVKKMARFGAGEILLTSMDYDGTREGYDIELTRMVSESVRIPVIASGGAGNLEHLYAALTDGKADAVLAASIFHFREYSVREAKTYLQKRKVAVRL